MRIFYRVISFIVVILSLSACAPMMTQPVVVKNPAQQWDQIQPVLNAMNTWHIAGEIGIILNQQASSANVSWVEKADGDYQIELYGPLGLGGAYLNRKAGMISLTLHDGTHYEAANAESLMNQVLGWSLPVEGLVYWVRGLPVPNVPYEKTLNAYGALATLNQEGWSIQYLNYAKIGRLVLPTKLKLQHKNLRLTIVIDQWR